MRSAAVEVGLWTETSRIPTIEVACRTARRSPQPASGPRRSGMLKVSKARTPRLQSLVSAEGLRWRCTALVAIPQLLLGPRHRSRCGRRSAWVASSTATTRRRARRVRRCKRPWSSCMRIDDAGESGDADSAIAIVTAVIVLPRMAGCRARSSSRPSSPQTLGSWSPRHRPSTSRWRSPLLLWEYIGLQAPMPHHQRVRWWDAGPPAVWCWSALVARRGRR